MLSEQLDQVSGRSAYAEQGAVGRNVRSIRSLASEANSSRSPTRRRNPVMTTVSLRRCLCLSRARVRRPDSSQRRAALRPRPRAAVRWRSSRCRRTGRRSARASFTQRRRARARLASGTAYVARLGPAEGVKERQRKARNVKGSQGTSTPVKVDPSDAIGIPCRPRCTRTEGGGSPRSAGTLRGPVRLSEAPSEHPLSACSLGSPAGVCVALAGEPWACATQCQSRSGRNAANNPHFPQICGCLIAPATTLCLETRRKRQRAGVEVLYVCRKIAD